jgi:hypothetical protein
VDSASKNCYGKFAEVDSFKVISSRAMRQMPANEMRRWPWILFAKHRFILASIYEFGHKTARVPNDVVVIGKVAAAHVSPISHGKVLAGGDSGAALPTSFPYT